MIHISNYMDVSMASRQWRVGAKLRRTVYLQVGNSPSKEDPLVAFAETEELAEYIVKMHNNSIGK